MNSGWLGSRRLRFDTSEEIAEKSPHVSERALDPLALKSRNPRLHSAIEKTRDYLLDEQRGEGYWVAELEGDTILESEYILLLAYLGMENSQDARMAANYILGQQLPEGGWSLYPGGPLEISASVKAYFALKLTDHSPDIEPMQHARDAILNAGGAERINSFTRFYLALLGIIDYSKCPAVPPELILTPRWMPFNVYEMSAWSRTILIPLSIMWSFKPVRRMSVEYNIDEIFLGNPSKIPATMPPAEHLDELRKKRRLNWDKVFHGLDLGLKTLEKLRIRPLRKIALGKAEKWMKRRFKSSDGLGAIFPPIVWSVVALRCLGYPQNSIFVQDALEELKKLSICEDDTLRLQPCMSPVWDTALTTLALREADLPTDHPAIRKSIDWLLKQEIREKGDWSVLNPGHEPSGWCFEFNNRFYPDIDDTAMVLTAICRCLPSLGNTDWSADFLLGDWSPHQQDQNAAAILSSRNTDPKKIVQDIEEVTPKLTAIWRGVRWLLAMQSKNGGWGAFDSRNDRELFTRVPFADHNAMIDPPTCDLTARILELFAGLNLDRKHSAVQKAVEFVWAEQENDFTWYGRWGVNYIYGTWQCLVGLTATGIPLQDPRIQSAARWLISKQQVNGGWGETARSYDDAALKGTGPTTASQTAWAIMGLIAAGEVNSPSVERGIEYLLETQNTDGTWDEIPFTGTGFPKVFYLKYHFYRIYFPLMAMARYARMVSTKQKSPS